MRHVASVILAGLLLVWPGRSWSSEEKAISLVSIVMGRGLQTEAREGVYATLIGNLLANVTHFTSYIVLPLRRAVDRFRSGEADCIWGLDAEALAKFGLEEASLLESEPVLSSAQHVFTVPPQQVVSSTADLRGLSVGVSLGMAGTALEARLIAAGAQIVFLPTLQSKAFVLERRRVDAIVGWLPDMLIVFEEEGYKRPQFASDFMLMTAEISVVCHRSEKLSDFLVEVNRAIDSAKQSGLISSLFERFVK